MPLSRRAFLATAASAALAQSPTPPNVIVLYTDDQGIGDVGCYGAKDAQTPNLDRLASSGVRFTDWYSNCPVCSPSRASVLTGKYPQRTGITNVLDSSAAFNIPGLRAGETTLPGELRKLGYRTAAVGKWHLGSAEPSRPRAQGFDEFFGFYSGWIDGFSHRYYNLGKGNQIAHDLWRNDEEVWEEPEYHTNLFTREAKAFIERQNSRQPFFLYLAHGAPHYSMMAPRRYLERFPAGMDRDRRMHLAMVACIDDGLGEIRALLEKKGLARNTLIFFQSDNGATQETRADHAGRPYRGGSNAPFRGWKQGLFEGGIRMPAIMSWPARIPAGRTVEGIGMAMDILPTVLRWASPPAVVPSGVDGADVGPMVTGSASSPHDAVFWDYMRQGAVRRGDWKLILNPPDFPGDPVTDSVWLSNLKQDPGERTNLAARNPRIVGDLTARLEKWKEQWKPAASRSRPRPATA